MAMKDQGNGRDIPEINPVGIRKPLIRSVPGVSAQEPQSSAVTKLVEGVLQVVHRVDHMDEDLVQVGAGMVKGFAGVESKLDEQVAYLAGKIDVLLGVSSVAPALPPMRRREDSQSAIEDLSHHVSSNVREEAQKIVDDPESTLDPETVTKLAEDAVVKALRAQREDDKMRALIAEKAERDRVAEEQKEQKKLDVNRAKDFRRNLAIAIVAALITGAFAIYTAYMAGHENGHDKGVADTLQAAPALTAPAVTTTAVLAPAVPASAPATVVPGSKK